MDLVKNSTQISSCVSVAIGKNLAEKSLRNFGRYRVARSNPKLGHKSFQARLNYNYEEISKFSSFFKLKYLSKSLKLNVKMFL